MKIEDVRRTASGNEIACALISMMARSTTRSKQRPDTLMQDRICRIENLLHRTAGPAVLIAESYFRYCA